VPGSGWRGRFSRAEGTLELVQCDDDAHRIPERAEFIAFPLDDRDIPVIY
jgi:hypothetical protein